jgi:hypothetical protein
MGGKFHKKFKTLGLIDLSVMDLLWLTDSGNNY